MKGSMFAARSCSSSAGGAAMDDRTVDRIFAGSLQNLPPVSSKIVRIFTSSTFTGQRPP